MSQPRTSPQLHDPGGRAHRLDASAAPVLGQVAPCGITAPNAPTHRAIMQAFSNAMARYVIELRPAEVLRGHGDAGYDSHLDPSRRA